MTPIIEYSIVIPFFNEERSVKPLYESVKRTMDLMRSSYELIFANDGSADGTLNNLKEIAGLDEKIIVIDSKVRRRQTAALRAGFENARGEIVLLAPPKERPYFQEDSVEICQFRPGKCL